MNGLPESTRSLLQQYQKIVKEKHDLVKKMLKWHVTELRTYDMSTQWLV
jgi:hypothetical protein